MRKLILMFLLITLFGTGLFARQGAQGQTQSKDRVFEIRTYTANEGKLPALLKQFRDQLPLFEKYGMPAIFYSVAAEEPRSSNTFIYVLAHESREAARKSWAGFVADPIFRAAAQEADKDGKAVAKIESIFVRPADFSPMK